MMMMTLRNNAKIASSHDFTDHTSRFLCGSHKNHVIEMDDLRNHIWLFGAAGRLIFFVSSPQNHGRRLWVSLTYEKTIYPTGRKSHTTTPSSLASYTASFIYGGHAETRLLSIFGMATSSPKFSFQRVREATSFI